MESCLSTLLNVSFCNIFFPLRMHLTFFCTFLLPKYLAQH